MFLLFFRTYVQTGTFAALPRSTTFRCEVSLQLQYQPCIGTWTVSSFSVFCLFVCLLAFASSRLLLHVIGRDSYTDSRWEASVLPFFVSAALLSLYFFIIEKALFIGGEHISFYFLPTEAFWMWCDEHTILWVFFSFFFLFSPVILNKISF